MPVESKTCGKINYVKNRDAMCLTGEQAKYVYKKVEEGKAISINIMQHEQSFNREHDNPYERVILNQVYKDNNKTPYMEHWSIFSDNVRYVYHNEKTPHRLDLKALDYRHHKELYFKMKKEGNETLDIDFGIGSETVKARYLDVYENVHPELIYSNRFDETSDLSATYLGQTKMTRDTKVKAEERFPITGYGFASGNLLDGTSCQILLDTGATKSYMSKSFYLKCKCLHALPNFGSNTQRNQVGNGQYVGVLFVIPVIIDIHRHRFEIFTLVSEIHENVDLVMGMKNVFELEGVIDSHESCFSFLNGSIPFSPKKELKSHQMSK